MMGIPPLNVDWQQTYVPLLRSAHSGEWTVVGKGSTPLPTRPLSPSASRTALRRLGGASAGRAKDVVISVHRRVIEVRNFMFATRWAGLRGG